ncbi:family 78 glycoside hydrolase catalytic domain [Cellulophaga baltica]|uniref:alpha-L-rhamnosidase-related protein n=1 Tax=Cellulophaga TaxID=104264 RepID=UPI001C06F352|nr:MULTISPECIES: alpha-L-rhamnosidase C-terminal domain-containing protein [Cellulophaga]MBU2996677.1 family 78 glycoside hydrolase catalytic domain [Cellulophaga baltica]MDO6768071.1 family 78 glycoside hydrolase catalytic domain [Cellulophaga sp. 1_MG-2023]
MKKIYLTAIICMLAYFSNAQTNTEFNNIKVSYFNPEKVTKIEDGHYLIDFGKAFFGTVVLESNQTQNDSLFFHLGEKLKNNSIDKKPGATIRYRKSTVPNLQSNSPITIDMVPYKRNTTGNAIMLPDSIGTIIPFRYFEIENLKIPIEAITIKQKAIHYNFNDDASYFTSSNEVMNAIWDLCKHTIKATSFTGYYVDGDRERIPYEADAYINQLSHYSVDNDYSIARRTNEYFLKNPTWPTEWILHTVLMFHADYMYTGDLEPLKKHYDNLKLKTLMELEREDGLISSSSPKLSKEFTAKLGFEKGDKKIQDIIDWPPAQKDTGWKLATPEGERDGYEIVKVNTAINAFYYYNLKLMSEIAGFLDKEDDVTLFKIKAEKVKKTINAKFLDKTNGYYIDGEGSTHASLHGNMLPLAFDLVPDEYVSTVTKFIKSRGMACSVYGAQYLLEGLYKYNEEDYASNLITETENDRSWWNMIQVGATMTMEAWDVKYKPNSDWNHAWGTAPLNAITRYMWGIQPKTAGFETAIIEPKLGDLTFTKIKVPTKNGSIYSDYKLINKTEGVYEIEIPETMNAEFVLPNNTTKAYLNGKKVRKKHTEIKLSKGKNIIKIQY